MPQLGLWTDARACSSARRMFSDAIRVHRRSVTQLLPREIGPPVVRAERYISQTSSFAR